MDSPRWQRLEGNSNPAAAPLSLLIKLSEGWRSTKTRTRTRVWKRNLDPGVNKAAWNYYNSAALG